MAEFLTMQEAEDKFGKKGKTNAALTLGIIGTALGAFSGNNGCGCGNNGILGGLFDVIIPNGVSIVNQTILDELPTSLPVKGNCAYSVFEIQLPATVTPSA